MSNTYVSPPLFLKLRIREYFLFLKINNESQSHKKFSTAYVLLIITKLFKPHKVNLRVCVIMYWSPSAMLSLAAITVTTTKQFCVAYIQNGFKSSFTGSISAPIRRGYSSTVFSMKLQTAIVGESID